MEKPKAKWADRQSQNTIALAKAARKAELEGDQEKAAELHKLFENAWKAIDAKVSKARQT
jgi:hypothetical protein